MIPSDLTGFLRREHMTHPEFSSACLEFTLPDLDRDLSMYNRRGLEYDGRHLAGFEAAGVKSVEIAFRADTMAALHAARMNFQGNLFDGRSAVASRRPDVVDRPSNLGGYSYEAADAKLVRNGKPSDVLQCWACSEHLANIQCAESEPMRLIFGDDREVEIRLQDLRPLLTGVSSGLSEGRRVDQYSGLI